MNLIEQFKNFALLGAEWVMWVLVILSVVSVSFIIDRALAFKGQRPNVDALIHKLKELIRIQDYDGALDYLAGIKGVGPRVAESALTEAAHGIHSMEQAASATRIRLKLSLERNLSYLGTVGNSAPFLGLLGTVVGIIQAFHDLSFNTTGGASTVMAGVSGALVSTAIGLLVAIPAVVAYNTYQRRIRTLLGDADALVHTVLSVVDERTGQSESPSPRGTR